MASDKPPPNDDIPHDLVDAWADLSPLRIPRLSEQELVKFVIDYCDNRIFLAQDLGDNEQMRRMIELVFLPIALGGLHGFLEKDFKAIGTIWEYYAKALPRTVNRFPIFLSCYLMHAEDWTAAKRAIIKELDRRKQSASSSVLADLRAEVDPSPDEPVPPA